MMPFFGAGKAVGRLALKETGEDCLLWSVQIHENASATKE